MKFYATSQYDTENEKKTTHWKAHNRLQSLYLTLRQDKYAEDTKNLMLNTWQLLPAKSINDSISNTTTKQR